jgi:hypothetical protein
VPKLEVTDMATANAAERIKPVSSLGSVTLFHSFLPTPRTYLKKKRHIERNTS